MKHSETKKTIVLIRSTAVSSDPRVEKYGSWLASEYNVIILGWDREARYPKEEAKDHYIIHRFRLKGKYGTGIRNAGRMLLWWMYEFVWLMRHHFDFVHACDFDTYPPALCAKWLKRRKIVYDIFDFYADMVLRVPRIFIGFLKRVDLFLLHFTDAVVIADESRASQLGAFPVKDVVTIYNTPPDFYDRYRKTRSLSAGEKGFLVTYVGLLKRERGLDQIIDVVREMETVTLVLGGYGRDEEYVRKRIRGAENIRFVGRVEPYEKTLEVLSSSDALIALYDPHLPLHKFASPNKLFEAMMFGIPLITNIGIGADRLVEQYDCGVIIDYGDKDHLRGAFSRLIAMKEADDTHFGKNGRTAYETIFSPIHMRERILSLYRGLQES